MNIKCKKKNFCSCFINKCCRCFEACRPACNKWFQRWDANPKDRDEPPLQHDDDSSGTDHINTLINLHWIIECFVFQTFLIDSNRLHQCQDSQHPCFQSIIPCPRIGRAEGHIRIPRWRTLTFEIWIYLRIKLYKIILLNIYFFFVIIKNIWFLTKLFVFCFVCFVFGFFFVYTNKYIFALKFL